MGRKINVVLMVKELLYSVRMVDGMVPSILRMASVILSMAILGKRPLQSFAKLCANWSKEHWSRGLM